MGSLWIIILSLTVLEVSALTPGPVICQIYPEAFSEGCVCGQSGLHSYCSTANGLKCSPDDFDNQCHNKIYFVPQMNILPDEWELMLDSHDYQNLVQDSSPAWITRDVDGDGGKWLQRGGICQYDLRACSYTLGQQNNWVFTQHIKYPPGSLTIGTTEIFLDITFRFSQCTTNPACTNDFVTLYRFDTNAIEPISRQNDPANYIPLFGPGTETTDSRLKQVNTTDITVVRSFRPPGDYTGFYLGIRDTGTCGQVKRILLYYTPCKKLQDGLVNYPEVVRPPAGSGPNIAEACCAPNSTSTTNRTVRAHSDGRCDRGVMCVCNAGYRLDEIGTACIACLAGTYRSPMNPQDQCLNCPMNTTMDIVAAPNCPCIVGYFRDTNEGPGFACTCPSSPVLNLRATQIRNKSVTVTWTRPEEICRNDFYYIVEYSDPDNYGNFLLADRLNTRYFNSAPTVTYRVPTISSGLSLRPYTNYTIRVTVHNGVSDQDVENEPLRRIDIFVTTKEGVPSVPVNVQPLAGVIVWGPPAEPNGVITGYDVRFSDTSKLNPIIPNFATYHIVSDSDVTGLDKSNTLVRVRAKTSVGTGEYSTPQKYSVILPPACPTTSSPVSCTTPPPCPTCPSTECTCPPPFTYTCPACPTCPTSSEPTKFPTTLPPKPETNLKFMLGDRTYLNNTIVLITDIGEGDNALLCMTDSPDCCKPPNGNTRQGEFYYPDNSAVGYSFTNSLYRNRGPQVVRLNRRNNALSPTGVYRCQIPDSIGIMQNIYITIIPVTDLQNNKNS